MLAKLALSFGAYAIAMVAGCTATPIKPEASAEKQSPNDAWEKRLERIMNGEEVLPAESKQDSGQDSLEQQYKKEQKEIADSFEDCFAKVFAGRTFDGGIPWKSEGQGYRDIGISSQ